MNPLNILRKFDPDLYGFFEKELEHQHGTLSFIPDENSTSPLCAAIMGNVLVNSVSKVSFNRSLGLEAMATKRVCELFNAEHANLRTITIEAASRVVFQALTKRGDVVMSLDLRKKEHCNSENFAFRFVNFGIDPKTQQLDYEAIEKQALVCKPQLIIVSPINYPLDIDYERFARIAKDCGALLWCDISQVAGLIAGGVLSSPFPHADIVTFSAHGALQGPHGSVILSSNELANAIDRVVTTSGHNGLLTAELAALASRMQEMKGEPHRQYVRSVVDNAKALAEGLQRGGAKIISNGTQSHFVMVDCKSSAIAARGAQEVLSQAGVMVRICNILTSDPNVKYEAVRFSTLVPTTRGVTPIQMENIGEAIAQVLMNPDDKHIRALHDLVSKITCVLPAFSPAWLEPSVRENLSSASYDLTESSCTREQKTEKLRQIGELLLDKGNRS